MIGRRALFGGAPTIGETDSLASALLDFEPKFENFTRIDS